jgi:hypothetical protein
MMNKKKEISIYTYARDGVERISGTVADWEKGFVRGFSVPLDKKKRDGDMI